MQLPRARGWIVGAICLAVATAMVGMALAPVTASAASVQVPLTPASDYANLNSPSGDILFGSPLPQVEVLSTVNESLAAVLALDYLLELAPNASDPAHPEVVAVAAPETLARFNGSIPPAVPWVNLIATLPVYPAATPLWTNGTTVNRAANVFQQAILDVNYSVATASDGSAGVLVSWAVSGWPWTVPAGDELALEYQVQVVAGTGFQTCTGAATGSAPGSSCAAQPLSPHQPVWGSGLTALKGSGPAGSEAWVSWGRTVSGAAATSTGVNAGVYPEGPGVSALVIAAAADGASAVAGSTLLYLSLGPANSLAGALVGSLPIYGGAAALFTAGAGIGIFLSRRRDRAIARDLAA